MITSVSNQQMKYVKELLNKSKQRKREKCFVAEGIRMVAETPADRLVKIYVSESFYKNPPELRGLELSKALIVDDQVFRQISDTQTPQGIMAVVRQQENCLEDILKQPDALLLFLENIQDPGNLGTMMPFVYADDFCEAIGQAKAQGIRLYAAHLKGRNNYDGEDYRQPSGFLIGNEGNGLTKEAADSATDYIRIPMGGQLESLNASVAAAVLMYEANRQRRKEY